MWMESLINSHSFTDLLLINKSYICIKYINKMMFLKYAYMVKWQIQDNWHICYHLNFGEWEPLKIYILKKNP